LANFAASVAFAAYFALSSKVYCRHRRRHFYTAATADDKIGL